MDMPHNPIQRAPAAPPPPPLAKLDHVMLSLPTAEGETQVIDGISLELSKGEIVAVTGPSGSGKSSLIALISGLERPTGGRLEVLGMDLASSTEAERTKLRRRQIGIIYQAYHLVPAMTALQNVALPLILAGDDDALDRAEAMLKRLGLGHRISHRPTALSGGEQQRVAVARAFLAKPELVLADEPTGNLDQKTGGSVAEIMFELTRETDAAMMLVTHDPALAGRCDRILRIDHGRLVQ